MRLLLAAALLAVCTIPAAAAAAERRTLVPADVLALKDVGGPQLSPDGQWVAFTVRTLRAKEDDADTDVFMVPFAGGDALRVTTSDQEETHPRFSPDGRFLAFLSERHGKRTQVYLLDRRGGEAAKLTDYPGSVSDLAWSPDGQRLALVVSDADPNQPADAADEDDTPPRPIVITRRQFKRDGEGYLTDVRSHLHVFDVARRTSVQLTSGSYDDRAPAWSPDGKHVAFVSNRTADPDSNQNTDVFVVAATGGALRTLVASPGEDGAPVFSPDGKQVAFLQGGDPADMWYAPNRVAVVPFAGGPARALTASLDRNVYAPRFSPNGASVLFLLEDGGNSHLARVAVAGGAVERLLAGERDVQAFDVAKGAQIAVLESRPHLPFEVSAAEGGEARRLSHVNDAFLAGIALAPVERFEARSADGTRIQGFLTRPPGAAAGAKLPAILRIHGGPVMQYSTAFELEWQMLAAAGYAVVAANPRGSSGYGRDFSRAIWADWGNKDYDDVTAAVEHAIGMGVADADRLGVGGWSYGGILTDYVITKTGRFKAAISGASETNYLANYGTDHYQYEWETELGLPWQNRELWMRLSPWFAVEKVTTPTLLLCGSDDQNVPLVNSEQFYQALRRLGRETELVIYPGETHDIERPSFQVDRFQRYLAWYDKYLKPGAAAAVTAPEATSLLGRPLARPPVPADRQAALDTNLAAATAAFVKAPDDADAILWLGRRTAYLGRFREAIDVYTRGIERHPRDARFYRHRGHRYLTLREIDKAEADLARAAELIRGTPDAVEPDGEPNAANVPTSTLHFNVWYHLGLARYLKADFAGAARAYRECLLTAKDSPDRLVAASDWLYLTLRRQGRTAEAAALLGPITADLAVIENTAYRNRLLLYKGARTAEEIRALGTTPVDAATYGYGLAAWHLVNGRTAEAKALLEEVAASGQWPAFGVLAAEADIERMR
ncbi:MAG: prolyl oligopeptidase family serine peptidase [Vicinamibacteria bacterium]